MGKRMNGDGAASGIDDTVSGMGAVRGTDVIKISFWGAHALGQVNAPRHMKAPYPEGVSAQHAHSAHFQVKLRQNKENVERAPHALTGGVGRMQVNFPRNAVQKGAKKMQNTKC